MNLEPHATADEMKVWLSQREVELLLESTTGTEQAIALDLGVRCGLRSHEVLDVSPSDVIESDAGTILRVHHGKGDKFRETPMPDDLATVIRTVADVRDAPDTRSLVSVETTRSLRRWLRQAARVAAEADENDPDGWQHLSFHDLRRTWATQLRSADVDPLLVCDWGGWNDLETFLDHYQGTHTPESQRRERGKVDWL